MIESRENESVEGTPVIEAGVGTERSVMIEESPRGHITLPAEVYQRIESQLPACIRRGDDDAVPRPEYPAMPLRQTYGGTTVLRTRNVWLIRTLLENAGLSFEFRRWFMWPCCYQPIARRAALLALTKHFRGDVNRVTKADWSRLDICRYGQIVATDDTQKFSLAAMLCAAFPQAPVVFVVGSRAEVDQVAAEIEKRLWRPVHRAIGLHARPEFRITVTTYIAFRDEDLRDAPFVIVPNWRPGYPQWMRLITWGPFRDRIYFLRTKSERLSAIDADSLDGRLGPVLIGPAEQTAIHVFSTFGFGGRLREHLPRVARERHEIDKRKLYWRHRRRNQAIAGLGAAIATESATSILVENPDHAEWLVALLPGWPVVLRYARPATLPPRCIVTLLAAHRWPEFRPQQLIFAAGGGPSEWLDGWLAEMGEIGHDVHLFDLTDAFDPTAAAFARARTSAYRRAGCHWRPLVSATVKAIGRNLRLAQRAERRGPTESR